MLFDIIIEAAENKKALDIKIIDLKKLSKESQNLVIMSGESSPQLKAIGKEIQTKLEEHGLKKLAFEGEPKSGWLILDAGSIIIHVMAPTERKYYNLEELWGKEGIIFHC
ncbi:MAG: ribosome silencing factor [Candidatus Saganbacteria bacterium]|nr:ribosome silencing factor [Candidatus Saganbacteria bacterium]